MPVVIDLDAPATRESVRKLVRDRIFETDFDPKYDPEHLKLVHAYMLHHVFENEERLRSEYPVDVGDMYSVEAVLTSGFDFKVGLEAGLCLARGDRKAFPSALKRALKQLKD